MRAIHIQPRALLLTHRSRLDPPIQNLISSPQSSILCPYDISNMMTFPLDTKHVHCRAISCTTGICRAQSSETDRIRPSPKIFLRFHQRSAFVEMVKRKAALLRSTGCHLSIRSRPSHCRRHRRFAIARASPLYTIVVRDSKP
jgi:hypothetical protein